MSDRPWAGGGIPEIGVFVLLPPLAVNEEASGISTNAPVETCISTSPFIAAARGAPPVA